MLECFKCCRKKRPTTYALARPDLKTKTAEFHEVASVALDVVLKPSAKAGWNG